MNDLKINAQQVVASANRIKNLNTKMKNGFADVQTAVQKMDNAWDSPAASAALSKFNSIKNTYCQARYDALDNFVAFLHQQVGQGYDQAEAANKSLADQFK